MEGMALGSRFSLSAACKKQQPGVTARGNLNDEVLVRVGLG